MRTVKLILFIVSFQVFNNISYSQVAPFIAFHASDTNGIPYCQQIDTNICFTILQHSGILDAVNNGLFLMDYNTLTFALPGWYSDDGISYYYWSGSGWDPCVEYCGLPPITITGDSIVYSNSTLGYSVIDTAGSSYYWVITSGNILSGQGTGNIQIQWGVQGNGLITLIQTYLNGCIDTLIMPITILGNTNINKKEISNLIVYPNPANDHVTLNIKGYNGLVNIELYDFSGKLLRTTNKKTINLNTYASGSYILKVYYKDMIEEI